MSNHKCFAGRVISQPIIMGKNSPFKAKALKVIQTHGFTLKALDALREAGVDPDRLKVSALVRVKFVNGKILKPTYLVNIPCSLYQVCAQEISKSSTVLFLAEGIAPWTEKNRKMENGDKIHDPYNYQFDSFVIDPADDEPAEPTGPIDLTFDESPKARALTQTGTAQRTLYLAKVFEEELKTEELVETTPEPEVETPLDAGAAALIVTP